MSLDDAPSEFEGVLPVLPPNIGPLHRDRSTNAANGLSAASMRAFTAQAVAFYFRAPAKAFFRTRVDYLAYAKQLTPQTTTSAVGVGKWSWSNTTPGLLAHAIRTYGWRFLPEQVLPPLAANVAVGAILYTSYLQILGLLHEPSSHSTKRVFPPPSPTSTFTAGFAAGGIQSLVAAPLDALSVRFDKREAHYRNKSMWHYAREKLRDIGARGIFAGWSLSFIRDSVGSGLFFCTFEYIQSQAYINFVKMYYGKLEPWVVEKIASKRPLQSTDKGGNTGVTTIKPHYALEPAFLTLAGLTASIAQQSIIYPLSLIQTVHYERLEELDQKVKQMGPMQGRARVLRAYYHAYQETWMQCIAYASGSGGLSRWLYRGFWGNAIRQVPGTSAGLVIFELVRRRYGLGNDVVRIQEGGYDVLLS